MSYEIFLFAYIIDKYFGEFPIKHPVQYMGDYILWFEKLFYKDSKLKGLYLVISLIFTCCSILFIISLLIANLNIYFQFIIYSVIASQGLAHKMLFDSVKNILITNNPKAEIAMLVSRDTENMTESDIYKAAIETYAENLSDGVIAPLFYLILFGIWGLFIYKAINTLDSMVGYKTEKYKNYGYFSAKIDDIVNYIPARITAIMVLILDRKWFLIKDVFSQAQFHASPNAGYPITAIALTNNIQLGGPTYYHGKLTEKPYFGTGSNNISKADLENTLKIKPHIDITIIAFLSFLLLFKLLY